MRFHKSTCYALYAALELARHDRPITVGEVVSRYEIPEGALAKVFQRLIRAGIATGVRGVGGGHVLARPKGTITMLDVISVFEDPMPCSLSSATPMLFPEGQDCPIVNLLGEVEQTARDTFASVTLETLIR